ncbi:MAG: pantoate--beta-alanine ligase [Bdellovibrionales bacterium]|nr:pantoate--beta-alanine ligase [Bdellovibrionales bacterium]
MKTYEDMTKWIDRREEILHHGQTIGFVPTMGALHAGHVSLIKNARAECDFVVVSIFVNPTQFNSKEDLESYPRNLSADLALLDSLEVDAVLTPTEAEIYSDKFRFKITETQHSELLCGAYRPGHFTGVLTVVAKLLGLTQAHRCYMGEKDYQQYLLVHDMVHALNIRSEIIACPTAREESGLAMSSRNARLSSDGRNKAALIYKYISEATSCKEASDKLAENGFDVDYVEEHWGRRFVAASIENVRLIDNVKI